MSNESTSLDPAGPANPDLPATEPAGAPSMTPGQPKSAHRARRPGALAAVERFGLVLILVVSFAVFSFLLPETFPTIGNARAMINSQAIVLLLALALTLPLRSGDFDLSIAGTMTASGALVATLTTSGMGVLPAVLAALALGAVVGLLNGVLVVKVGINSFIVTLGMSTALGGLGYAITGSTIVPNIPDTVLRLARSELFGLPSIVWCGWLLVVVFWYVYEHTPLGRYLLFIGGSPGASRLAGLKVDRIKIGAFVACSLLAALTGVLFAGQVGQLDPSVAGQFLLQPFAAAFLGATVITVGRFNALGTLIALYLLNIFVTGLQLFGAQPWVSDVFNGCALILAVTFARIAARMSGRA